MRVPVEKREVDEEDQCIGELSGRTGRPLTKIRQQHFEGRAQKSPPLLYLRPICHRQTGGTQLKAAAATSVDVICVR